MNKAAVAFAVLALAGSARAQVTQRVSVSSQGVPGDFPSGSFRPNSVSMSADGRYVAFDSEAHNLVSGDTNAAGDIFVRDRWNGTTERVSVDSAGVQGNGFSFSPSISADGRYVAFHSSASNLVVGDTNGFTDVFVHDRQSGTTERVSIDSGGTQGNWESGLPSISADGRYVAFESEARNLVVGDSNGHWDIFVHDRQTGATERVSVDTNGSQVNGDSYLPAISADGRFVAFGSFASDLVSGDTNGVPDIFVRDRLNHTTQRVSVSNNGVQGDGDSYGPSISADGHFVAFWSYATNLVAGDTNGVPDDFVRDLWNGQTRRVSIASGGAQANNACYYSSISADGRYVAFSSLADNLVGGDFNGYYDVFIHDRQTGVTDRMSVSSTGGEGDDDSGTNGISISADGRYTAFDSAGNLLVPGDTNGIWDVFVHDRTASGFTSLCDPGVGGVNACPCANPPGGSGRGCDNSAATGGAILSASGIAYLSMDSLVFTTSGEMPTATSILLQGTASSPAGIVYGQGVRCVGGLLKRLFTKSAAAGSITAPDFGAGDPTVSARSAAKGDVIQAGQSRWYLVYYRDPNVLGGCPASSTFNATQTGQIAWSL